MIFRVRCVQNGKKINCIQNGKTHFYHSFYRNGHKSAEHRSKKHKGDWHNQKQFFRRSFFSHRLNDTLVLVIKTEPQSCGNHKKCLSGSREWEKDKIKQTKTEMKEEKKKKKEAKGLSNDQCLIAPKIFNAHHSFMLCLFVDFILGLIEWTKRYWNNLWNEQHSIFRLSLPLFPTFIAFFSLLVGLPLLWPFCVTNRLTTVSLHFFREKKIFLIHIEYWMNVPFAVCNWVIKNGVLTMK